MPESELDPMLKELYATTDADVWARRFCETHEKISPSAPPLDLDWVRGWFANAIETAKSHTSRAVHSTYNRNYPDAS